jgi:hypothetical protein
MASTYSTNLAIELIGTGDQAGTWGNTTNTNLGTLIEQAISGYVTQAVSTGTDTTITIPNGATGVARNMYIELTGTGGASTNLIVPANKKLYFIFNNTSSGQVTVKVSGQTGVSVPNKAKVILVSDGTDIIDATNYIGSAVIGNITATSGTITTLASTSAIITTLTSTSAGITTLSSGSANITQLNSTSGTISTLASTSAAITTLSGTTLTYSSASITNLTATSLVLSNLSIASANITTLTSSSATISTTLALSGGTANGVLYLNGSKVATSGSALTFTGTNLGIGTASAATPLEITSTTQSGIRMTLGSEARTHNISATNNGRDLLVLPFRNVSLQAGNGIAEGLIAINAYEYTIFGTGASYTERMRLTDTGLGIGTSSPAAKLDVAGIIRNNGSNVNLIKGGTSGVTAINFGDASSGDVGQIIYDHDSNFMRFGTNDLARLWIDSSGNVGIGTSSPAYKLDVNGVISTGSGSNRGFFYSDGSKILIESTSTTFPLAFSVNSAVRATIDTSGNLGLGVTPSAWGSAAKAIDVGSLASFYCDTSRTATISTNQYINNSFQTIYKVNGEAIKYEQYLGHKWYYAASGTAGNAITYTTQMTLDTSGNLGLGVTPSAWNTDYRALQIKGGISLSNDGSNTDLRLGQNVFVNSSAENKYIATAAASRYRQSSGSHIWDTAASGTAGNTITFTQAMTLDASGNLGVGTTSPNDRLDVASGSATFRARVRNTTGGEAFFLFQNSDTGTTTTDGLLCGLFSDEVAYFWNYENQPIVFGTNNTERARITSDGNFAVGQTSAGYRITSAVASGADRDMFLSGVTGVSNGVYWQWINSTSSIAFRIVDLPTTASAANAYLDGTDGNRLYRSTSSIRYKKDVESVQSQYSENALNLRPVWYRSKAVNDNAKWSWYGLIAEEVAEIDPRLVHWSYAEEDYDVEDVNGEIKKTPKPDAKMIPDGVQYERLSVLLLDIVKKQNARLEKLEAEVAALKGA